MPRIVKEDIRVSLRRVLCEGKFYERTIICRLFSSERNLKRVNPKTWLVVIDFVLIQLVNVASLLMDVLSLLVIFVFKVPSSLPLLLGEGEGVPNFLLNHHKEERSDGLSVRYKRLPRYVGVEFEGGSPKGR